MRLPKASSRAAILRMVAVLGVAIALVAAGMIIGWRLAGPSTAETTVGRVAIEVHPSLTGTTEAIVPVADWGLRADAYDAPFGLRAELRSVSRPALLRAADGDLTVLTAIEEDLQEGVRSAIIRSFAWGGAATLILLVAATLVWRRLRPRWALIAVGVVLAVAGTAASLRAAETTFDAEAFETPTYFAQGAELGRILEVIEDERVRSAYGSTFASVLRSVSAVLAEEPAGQDAGSRTFYLASDLHGNPLVVDPFAEAIGDSPLLLTGDFGQRGGAAESALLAPRVAALGSRVIAVSGNHDSRRLMEQLAAEGVTVLTGDGRLQPSGEIEGSPLLEVDGITVAGFPDPLEWRGAGDPPDRPVVFDDLEDPEEAVEEAVAELVAWFDDLPSRPDVVMVHQNSLAQRLAEELFDRGYSRDLTIATGHDHAQHVSLYGSIVVADGGSVGAGGLFDAGRASIGLAELRFWPTQPALRSADLIAIEPFSGQAQASRVVVDALCPGEDRCRFNAPGLEATAPTE